MYLQFPGIKYAIHLFITYNALSTQMGSTGDMRYIITCCFFPLFLVSSSGCMVTKVVTTPVKWTVKGAYTTTKIATKGAVKAGKGAVKAVTYPFRDDESE